MTNIHKFPDSGHSVRVVTCLKLEKLLEAVGCTEEIKQRRIKFNMTKSNHVTNLSEYRKTKKLK